MTEQGNCTKCRLSVCALGTAFGITWALGVLLIGVLAITLDYGTNWVELLSGVYIGYAVSWLGVVIGTLWALVDGFICGAIIALVYNFCLKCCSCKSCSPKGKPEQ